MVVLKITKELKQKIEKLLKDMEERWYDGHKDYLRQK
jgi:hypothetical protein